jgi:hypothetical protein
LLSCWWRPTDENIGGKSLAYGLFKAVGKIWKDFRDSLTLYTEISMTLQKFKIETVGPNLLSSEEIRQNYFMGKYSIPMPYLLPLGEL